MALTILTWLVCAPLLAAPSDSDHKDTGAAASEQPADGADEQPAVNEQPADGGSGEQPVNGAGEQPTDGADEQAAGEQPDSAPESEEPDDGPEPWQPPPDEDRFVDGVPLLGPWPDGWSTAPYGRGLDLIDPLTKAVLQYGVPALEGPLEGPPPPLNIEPEQRPEAAETPRSGEVTHGEDSIGGAERGEATHGAGDTSGAERGEATHGAGQASATERDEVVHSERDAGGAERGEVVHGEGEPSEGEPSDEATHGEDGDGKSPPPPGRGAGLAELLPTLHVSPRQSLGFVLLAIGVGLLSIITERLRRRMPSAGLIPAVLRFGSGFGRLLTVVLLLLALLSGATGAWRQVVPFVLIGTGIALGWSSRDAIRDVLAGAVLLIEAPLEIGDRVCCGALEGMVVGLGPRAVLLVNDRGQSVSVPNRVFLEEAIAVDSNPYAPVEVNLHVPAGVSAEQIHQTLMELALLSPYLAPSAPPQVYRDPGDADVWIVEARLVSPLYRREFRGAMVELSEEVLGRCGAPVSGPQSATDPPCA